MSIGPFAFPRPLPRGSFVPDEAMRILQDRAGMTLRDYFAAAALQGLIASGCLTQTQAGHARPFNEREVADQAGAMADAMLSERSR